MDEAQFHWLVGILEGEGTFIRASPSSPGSRDLRRTWVHQAAPLAWPVPRALRAVEPRSQEGPNPPRHAAPL